MTATISRHLDPATLMSYAAGTLAEPLAAVVAAHLSLCPACRRELVSMDRIGAGLLAALPGSRDLERPAPARPGAGQSGDSAIDSLQAAATAGGRERLPLPIIARYGLSYDTIPWRRLAPGVWHHRLALSSEASGDLRLLKISPGRRMPEHGHGGAELTLVLEGAYSDETGAYRAGDVQDVDDETEHRPIADAEHGCICIIASERPARFKGLVERMLQPFTGM